MAGEGEFPKSPGDILYSSEINAIKTETPIGIIMPWLKSLLHTPQVLPTGWVECDGSVLSDADSLYDGDTLPDLNGGEFMRGNATSGGTGGSDTANLEHFHTLGVSGGTHTGANQQFVHSSGGMLLYQRTTGPDVRNNVKDSTDNKLSTTQDIKPKYYDVVWIIKIK